MRQGTILFLGPETSALPDWLRSRGEQVRQTTAPLIASEVINGEYSFLISHGYRHILPKEILDLFPGRAVNLHISYLPWNRGADPNFWSFVEDTPKGVSIHYLDEGIDTGDVIAQREIPFTAENETLATSYDVLQAAVQDLFREQWDEIRAGICPRRPQVGAGSCHRLKDKEPLLFLLTDGWHTPVTALTKARALKAASPRTGNPGKTGC